MRQLHYDLKLVQVIKSLRLQKGIKQLTLANALGVEQSTYSRIESGEIAITPGQLKIIAKEINTPIIVIYGLADLQAEAS